ncbi:hypothetical protein Hanom_Chr01g00044821 [Helianthus anomalus]
MKQRPSRAPPSSSPTAATYSGRHLHRSITSFSLSRSLSLFSLSLYLSLFLFPVSDTPSYTTTGWWWPAPFWVCWSCLSDGGCCMIVSPEKGSRRPPDIEGERGRGMCDLREPLQFFFF